MSDRIDWSSIIKPFISSNSENIDKNDTFNLVKAIIKRYVYLYYVCQYFKRKYFIYKLWGFSIASI